MISSSYCDAIINFCGRGWRRGTSFSPPFFGQLLGSDQAPDLLVRHNRAYSEAKIEENNTAEIMQVILEDARASYAEEIVVELNSDSPDQVESNVARIIEWAKNWREERI